MMTGTNDRKSFLKIDNQAFFDNATKLYINYVNELITNARQGKELPGWQSTMTNLL